jgi:hypothetical protein
MLSDPGDEFRKFGNSGIQEIPGHFCAISKFGSSGKNMFYRTLCAAGYPPGFQGKSGTFSDIFPEMSQILKMQKCQKTKKKNVPKTLEILGVLSKIGLWRFVEALKKCRK